MPELVPIPSPGVALTYGDAGDALVVVLHDEYGRLPGLEPFAQALAAQGFRVAVPDLYEGVATIDPPSAAELCGRVADDDVIDTIARIADAERAAGSERVGLLGFGPGGRLALLAAQTGAADAVVAYYASLADEEHGLVPCPVLLQLPETPDDPDEVAAFIERLGDHGTPVSSFRYAGTRAGFANATAKENFDKNAAALAFARSTAFLDAHLGD
ncbi:dienelactone hydrolase family protein [Galbitalea sp. SE-J8]|uniref:dienelactone hydrolase family protein n=1 Tax=Galbitalea sp. SE-J8 TaxID=3054952 RepID=UPI00259C9F8F|nr:dienelactone hydrolase family protein [Galbitalea sp. SE-J8]MDM4762298.1 dienelactone hydrolase family protein [Galbitalea sp. SE-J8]